MSRLRALAENPEREELSPREFCETCGAKNIRECEQCHTPIDHRYAGQVHNYCAGCGKPFPWTETALSAAKEYTDDLNLPDDEKAALKATFDDLTVDTPRTELAIHKFKKFLKKIGPAAGDVLTKIIVNVATEAAKKGLGGL